MSLEAKFAELKIEDSQSIVETVKKEGVKKSGLVDSIATLTAKAASKDETEALAALKVIKDLVLECPEAQAFTKECITSCKSIFPSFVFETLWLVVIPGTLCSMLSSKRLLILY